MDQDLLGDLKLWRDGGNTSSGGRDLFRARSSTSSCVDLWRRWLTDLFAVVLINELGVDVTKEHNRGRWTWGRVPKIIFRQPQLLSFLRESTHPGHETWSSSIKSSISNAAKSVGVFCLLLWINKVKAQDKMYMSVGVMKDYKLKLWKLRASHTLGWGAASCWWGTPSWELRLALAPTLPCDWDDVQTSLQLSKQLRMDVTKEPHPRYKAWRSSVKATSLLTKLKGTPKPPSTYGRWRTMCVQSLLDESKPSACWLVSFFKNASAILQSTCCCCKTQWVSRCKLFIINR